MAGNTAPTLVPLHYGRSFICYRDVNKAIDQHRELYGLKLTLKKSTKLENFPLTSEQQKTVNHRLKYGELDYNCSIDNGRVGRPGNDEKCDLGVRICLSPDARTLVVYQTHIHEYSEKKGYGKPINVPIMPSSAGVQSYPDVQHIATVTPYDKSNQLSISSLPSPSALAASLVAAAAAAAGPSALSSPLGIHQQQRQPVSSVASVVDLSPNNSLTIVPSQLAASFASSTPNSSTPNITIKSVPAINSNSISASTSMQSPTMTSPLPGQLLIPSFYSSKSTAGHITFNSSGGGASGGRNASALFNNSAMRALYSGNNNQSFNKSSKGHGSSFSNSNGNTSNETLKLKLKKSPFASNEMVIVGSARDTLEQQDPRHKSSPKTYLKKATAGNSSGGAGSVRLNAVVANLLEKVNNSNNSLSITHVMAPVSDKSTQQQQQQSGKVTISNAKSQTRVMSIEEQQHRMKLFALQQQQLQQKVLAAMSASNAGAGHRGGQQEMTGRPVTDPQQHQKGSIPGITFKRLTQKCRVNRVKKAEKAALKSKLKVKPLAFLHSNKASRPVGRPVGSTNASRGQATYETQAATAVSKDANENSNGSSSGSGSGLAGRKMRKCRQRPVAAASSWEAGQPRLGAPLDELLPIDTELGDDPKQRIAQRVMMQLLRTTTQLPMLEFTHAMETIGTLTDALRLKHRVQLSIQPTDDDQYGAFALLGPSADDDLSRPVGSSSPPPLAPHLGPALDVPEISLITPEKRGISSQDEDNWVTDADDSQDAGKEEQDDKTGVKEAEELPLQAAAAGEADQRVGKRKGSSDERGAATDPPAAGDKRAKVGA